MNRILIFYRVFFRKLYRRRIKGWKSASRNLSTLMLTMNFLSVWFAFEVIFNVKGFFYLIATNRGFPFGVFAFPLVGLLYVFLFIFFPLRQDTKVKFIRRSLQIADKTSKDMLIFIIVVSILISFLSIYAGAQYMIRNY